MTLRASTFGERLSAARRAAGLTQNQVATRVGVAQSTYSKWEAGESELMAVHLRPLAKALGLSLEDVTPALSAAQTFDDPAEKIGLQLVQRVATAIRDGRLGSRQARILLELLDDLAQCASTSE
jgi:transcriptional regulator with XRE-family HTH domain